MSIILYLNNRQVTYRKSLGILSNMPHSWSEMDEEQKQTRTDAPSITGRLVLQPLDPVRLNRELAEVAAKEEPPHRTQPSTGVSATNTLPNPPLSEAPYIAEVAKPTPTSFALIRFYGTVTAIAGIVTLIYVSTTMTKSAGSSFNAMLLYAGSITWGFGCFFGGIGLLLLRIWARSLLIFTFVISGLLMLPYLPFMLFLGAYAFASISTYPISAVFILPVSFTLLFVLPFVFSKKGKEQLS